MDNTAFGLFINLDFMSRIICTVVVLSPWFCYLVNENMYLARLLLKFQISYYDSSQVN